MTNGTSTESFPTIGGALLVLVPLIGGSLLLTLFEDSSVHELGIFLLAAGVIVGLALVFLRRDTT